MGMLLQTIVTAMLVKHRCVSTEWEPCMLMQFYISNYYGYSSIKLNILFDVHFLCYFSQEIPLFVVSLQQFEQKVYSTVTSQQI